MNARKCILVFGMTAILSMAVGLVHAESIPIVDPSFENFVITNPPYQYGQVYEAADFHLLLPWVVWQGALTNPAILDAALPGNGYGIDMLPGFGSQVAYLFCGDPNPANKGYWYQNLGTNFEAGKDYTLSIAGAMVETAANPGQTLEMRLGYWDGQSAAAGPTIVAEKLIGSDELTSSWNDFSISSGAVLGDAVGKPIVVYLSQGDNPYVTGPQYYIDNVRLSAVPEPSTFILLTSGLIGLLAYAWRKRK
jgi:hypothetical protein